MTNKELSKHGRRYSVNIKQKARNLRKRGWTHREIAKELEIAIGTAYLWTNGIVLTENQKKAVEMRRNKGCCTPSFMFTEKEKEKRRELARRYLTPFQFKERYTKTGLIQKIINFYKKNRRIPLKHEFNMYREYQQHFGSWNNAIRAAGFEPNQVIFSKRFIANDGHVCDSFSEKIIDDWLNRHNIKHTRHVPYRNSKMTADFAIGNFRIEFFGLAGVSKHYKELIRIKRNLCQKEKLKLIEIYPVDLFPKNRLPKIFNLKNPPEEL